MIMANLSWRFPATPQEHVNPTGFPDGFGRRLWKSKGGKGTSPVTGAARLPAHSAG
jgi:hypothetical protein